MIKEVLGGGILTPSLASDCCCCCGCDGQSGDYSYGNRDGHAALTKPVL